MQKGAQYQSVLEFLTEIFQDKMPADKIIGAYLRGRKYIGSKDRRFIADTVWAIIRRRRRLAFDASSEDPRRILLYFLRNEDFDVLCNSSPYSLTPPDEKERQWLKTENEDLYPPAVEAEVPDWLYDKIQDMALLKALNEPAPADLRINMPSREIMIKKLQAEGLFFRPTCYSPYGIRSDERINLRNCTAYLDGEIEVQDEASQIAAVLADVRPEHKTVDYCCGAGGKTLMMSFLNQNRGRIDVHDIEPRRLEALKERAGRLKVSNFKVINALTDKDYERFIVDAPCSGSGTWRRSPDAKFRLPPERLSELTTIQSEILETAYRHTCAGGRIVYFTCSVLKDENEDIISAFLAKHQDMQSVSLRDLWDKKLGGAYPCADEFNLRLNPLVSGTDGFFVSIMEKA